MASTLHLTRRVWIDCQKRHYHEPSDLPCLSELVTCSDVGECSHYRLISSFLPILVHELQLTTRVLDQRSVLDGRDIDFSRLRTLVHDIRLDQPQMVNAVDRLWSEAQKQAEGVFGDCLVELDLQEVYYTGFWASIDSGTNPDAYQLGHVYDIINYEILADSLRRLTSWSGGDMILSKSAITSLIIQNFIADNTTFGNIKLLDCRFADTTFSDLRVLQEESVEGVWENVHMHNGSLKGVRMKNVALKNVEIRNVRLENVSLSDVKLHNAVWKSVNASNASIHDVNFEGGRWEQWSSTAQGMPQSEKQSTCIAQPFASQGNAETDRRSRFERLLTGIEPRLQHQHWARLTKQKHLHQGFFPAACLRRLRAVLLPRLAHDLIIHHADPLKVMRVKRCRTTFIDRSKTLTTYSVTPLNGADLNDYKALLAVKPFRRFCNETMYSHLRFYCSADAALAFLHDHTRMLPFIRHVEVFYSSRPGSIKARRADGRRIVWSVPTSRQGDWRRFWNVLVHSCPHMESCHLTLGPDIWDSALWDERIFKVLEWPSKGKEEERSALEHVARLSGRKVQFHLSIQDVDGDDIRERHAMEENLQDCMRRVMMRRPRFKSLRECNCSFRTLKDSCITKGQNGKEKNKVRCCHPTRD